MSSSRTARRYLSRLSQACATQEAGQDLSAPALAFLCNPSERMSASVFSELLARGHVEPQGRRWHWTARAKAVQGQTGL